ncbi:hypothetical protein JDV09_17420 [Mycobacterium sp. Y57]|nr:hypothetical protein [Mycolicibacterium xanthum]
MGYPTRVLVGLLTAWAAIAFAASASADPADPVPPAVPPAPVVAPSQPVGPSLPGIGVPLGPDLLAQTGSAGSGLLGQPAITGLDPMTVLGQQPVPSPPGSGPGTPPNLSIFNNAYTLGQYLEPSAPGEGVQFGVPPGEENADLGRLEWFGRFLDMYRDGRLTGGMLGQMPESQLGQPLPGTAPLPGTNIPPGLVEYLPPPPAPPSAPTE